MFTEVSFSEGKKKKKKKLSEESQEVEEGGCFQYDELQACLFSAPQHVSLAHCVAEDFKMGQGIAVDFNAKFDNKTLLLSQGKSTGEVAVLKLETRYIFYLVTKETSGGKPTLQSLESSLLELKNLCRELNIRELAIPKIGCGLDMLNWSDVKQKIFETFKSEPISITLYVLPGKIIF